MPPSGPGLRGSPVAAGGREGLPPFSKDSRKYFLKLKNVSTLELGNSSLGILQGKQ